MKKGKSQTTSLYAIYPVVGQSKKDLKKIGI